MPPNLETTLSRLDPQLRQIFDETLGLLRKSLPSAVEEFDGQNLGLGVGSGYKGLVFVVSPHKHHVTVGFYDGASFPDPSGLLEGSGKRHRHVKIRDVAQLSDPAFSRLVELAVKRKTGAG
jgi:hypothetical protein